MSPELRDLLDGIASLPCAVSRRRMLRVLQQLANNRVHLTIRDVVRPSEVELAATLLRNMPRNEARAVLMGRLSCRPSKAYKLMREALAQRNAPQATHAQHGPRSARLRASDASVGQSGAGRGGAQ